VRKDANVDHSKLNWMQQEIPAYQQQITAASLLMPQQLLASSVQILAHAVFKQQQLQGQFMGQPSPVQSQMTYARGQQLSIESQPMRSSISCMSVVCYVLPQRLWL
jgi:hypothetical protein